MVGCWEQQQQQAAAASSSSSTKPPPALSAATRPPACTQMRALEGATSERKEKEAKLKEQVAKVQRMLNSSKTALDRARAQAEADAPLDARLKKRLDGLPNDV